MDYFVIGDEDTVLGFSLVGVIGQVACDKDSVEKAFDYALKRENTGIIIITISAANLIRDKVNQYMFSDEFPLLVEIPDSKHPHGENLRELAQKAIGVS